MFVLIAGGEPTGVQLAFSLIAQNYKVRVIEDRPEVLSHLHRLLPTEAIFVGHPTDSEALEQAGIRQADVLVTCTGSDADNLVLCTLAHKVYNVERAIARINDPGHAWLFDEKFSVDIALNESTILAHLIEEEMSTGDMMTLLKLRKGDYSLVEVRIPEKAIAVGKAIEELALPQQCVIAAILRQNEMILPNGKTSFLVDDEILAVTDKSGAEQLCRLLTSN
jgi:trk system potassium uptake protein